MKGHVSHCYEENVREQERLPFAWNFRVGFLGHMEQYNLFLVVKTGQNTMLFHLSKFIQLSSVDWGE